LKRALQVHRRKLDELPVIWGESSHNLEIVDRCFANVRVDRELAIAICTTVVQQMPRLTNIPSTVTVDVQKLNAWIQACPRPITDDAEAIQAAMGHDNFCHVVVTATK
jgi:hypothetical protein